MIFYSTNTSSTPATLKKATLEGLAPDGGLYVPSEIPSFSPEELELLQDAPFTDIAFAIAKKYTGGEIPHERLSSLIDECFNFKTPLVELDDTTFVEELFQGPTLAFKDYGARFLARMTGYFAEEDDRLITILVATSGDTGSAVAYGFQGIPNTRVVLLYPSGKVSRLQEQQLTTAGGNVTALEVNGDFDDCQRLVKQAFMDAGLRSKLTLTSANSINISRLIPQSFYYAWASVRLSSRFDGRKPVFCVPSGNYGNLTAGVLARKMGFPISHFIAASNANDSVTRYLEEGRYEPRPTVRTLSTAMDVGNPSNFARLLYMFRNDFRSMGREISGYSVSDPETIETIREVYDRFGYIMDPHTAVGFRALETWRQETPDHADSPSVVLSTAHPAKFLESIREALGRDISVPDRLQTVLDKQKISVRINADYHDLSDFLSKLDS
ncbi:threonine synthase [Prosthecochloris sp. N3]|uniref:Threonine synthase n=1 Tax=Prosthecochloris ethylica TaxID=2743976 RepID=A0ABR9XQS3_9CHLB|nr:MULTISPECIES: threonine synthase [Prosthecochloris]MEC9486153.1 threonine synthase [Prosthecochloris sp.]MBF0586407.1 threonine synthase [Prosthecochloris ethylica]MBF0636375.1 threonine synthase [Prosthecochloris ethylica]NUK47549.1 threonine synthase [Prosthecochloris ethylica]RNA64201.1 threonine synthase [Prosthecochloris sp. ZM_2]